MYYNPIDLNECNNTKRELEADGFTPELSTIEYTIKRETSRYNKYMKWHVTSRSLSDYYRTKNEAIKSLTSRRKPLPIGDRLIITHIIIK